MEFSRQEYWSVEDCEFEMGLSDCTGFGAMEEHLMTVGNPMDCSLPGFSVHGILQARILEWVAISFSRDLPDPGIKPRSPALQADALTSEPPGKLSMYISKNYSVFKNVINIKLIE